MNHLLTILWHTLIPIASANNTPSIFDAINMVGSPLSDGGGAQFEFGGIAAWIAASFLPILDAAAALTIVIAGLLSIIAQDENRIATTRKVVSGALFAIILVRVAGSIAKILTLQFIDGTDGTDLLAIEILGFLSWIEVPVLLFALLTIVISGIRTLITFGGEQGLTQLRQAVASVIFGIILIVIKFAISTSVVTGNPQAFLDVGVNISVTVLLYMGLAAVVVLVIAGIFMVVNIGNDEQYTRAKNLFMRVLIGLFVLLIAGTLALLIVDALVGE